MRKTNESLVCRFFVMVTGGYDLQLYVIGILGVGVYQFVVAGIGSCGEVASAWQAQGVTTASGTGVAVSGGVDIVRSFLAKHDVVSESAARLPSVVGQLFEIEVYPVVPLACYEYAAVVAVDFACAYLSVGDGPQVGYVGIFSSEESDEADDKE